MTTLTEREQHDKTLTSIDVLVKSLGTMVMIPDYESDPTQIGIKHFKGTIQQPILLGGVREAALIQLEKLIKTL